MVQRIGEVEPVAHTGHGLLQSWPVFCREAGMGQQVVEHLQHLLHREAVVPAQHPLQLQGHRLGQEQRLAGFDQIAGGPALAGRLFDQLGNYAVTLIILCGLFLLGALCALSLPRFTLRQLPH